ncbi:unnamed protein product [Pylaiella littoralis]
MAKDCDNSQYTQLVHALCGQGKGQLTVRWTPSRRSDNWLALADWRVRRGHQDRAELVRRGEGRRRADPGPQPATRAPPPRRQLVVEVAKIWRNSRGKFDWSDLHHALHATAMHAVDMGLTRDQRILEKFMFRRICVLRKFSCPKLTLAVFTDKLLNKRGVDKAQLDQDSKDARALQKAFGVAGGASAAGGGASHSSRSRGGLTSPAPMHFGGGALPQHGGPRLSAYVPSTRGGGSRSAGFGVGQPVMLPLVPGAPGGQPGSKGRGAGRTAPGGDHTSSQPLSGRARSAVADFNGIMQDAQQQFVPVPNGSTCDKCANANPAKNPHHEFRACAFSLCSRCKRGGHRAKVCPF